MIQHDLVSGDPRPVDKSDVPEADVQSKSVEYARRHNAWARKFASPANRSVPDYIFVWSTITWFVEFKRKGKLPTKQQYEEHCAIRLAGGVVWVCDDSDEFKRRFDRVQIERRVFHAEKDLIVPPGC